MVRWARLVGTAFLAAAAGFGVGYATRAGPVPASRRPAAVEQVLRALDAVALDRRGGAAALEAALAAVPSDASLDAASREDVALARLVSAGAPEPLWAFASGAPPSPARARALLWIAQRGEGDDARRRARDLFRARHPDAWPVADGGLR